MNNINIYTIGFTKKKAEYFFEMLKKSGVLWELVGDAGFEPATSTMSTWRSTPELIALPHDSAPEATLEQEARRSRGEP